MTIDEAIEDFKTMSKNARNDIIDSDDLEPQEKHYNSQLELYAKEKEQLAEWLELLKWYQQWMEDVPSESGVLPKDVYHAGYNKAIDDFAEKVIQRYHELPTTLCYTEEIVKEIAEQLKAGGKNERSV